MMKVTVLVVAAAMAASGPALARGGSRAPSGHHHTSSSGDAHTVSGHTTKNGTYVAPHRATNPNDTKHDNWSSKGNVNPDTGKAGTKDPNK